jgi:membrane-bound metal-dependent hydrolase YbcI (DUF457 family)
MIKMNRRTHLTRSLKPRPKSRSSKSRSRATHRRKVLFRSHKFTHSLAIVLVLVIVALCTYVLLKESLPLAARLWACGVVTSVCRNAVGYLFKSQ